MSDDYSGPPLDEVVNERQSIEKELERLRSVSRQALDHQRLDDGVTQMVRLARRRLSDPTPALMAAVFDLLELDVLRVDGAVYEGAARIPVIESDRLADIDGPEGAGFVRGASAPLNEPRRAGVQACRLYVERRMPARCARRSSFGAGRGVVLCSEVARELNARAVVTRVHL